MRWNFGNLSVVFVVVVELNMVAVLIVMVVVYVAASVVGVVI